MSLQIDNRNEITRKVIGLLSYLDEQYDLKDINSTVLKLENLGFILDSIKLGSYDIKGVFKNMEIKKALILPRYKIDEDIRDQLESLTDEYNTYTFESQQGIPLLELDSRDINWDEVYNTSIYARISLNTAIELLYFELKKDLQDND